MSEQLPYFDCDKCGLPTQIVHETDYDCESTIRKAVMSLFKWSEAADLRRKGIKKPCR